MSPSFCYTVLFILTLLLRICYNKFLLDIGRSDALNLYPMSGADSMWYLGEKILLTTVQESCSLRRLSLTQIIETFAAVLKY